jgi:hypothetical protein
MTFWVAARGTVNGNLELIEGDDAEPIVAFLLADVQYGRYGEQLVELDNVPCCEVVVRGHVAEAVLPILRHGDPVVALGLLRVTVPIGVANEANLVSLSVEAYSIGKTSQRFG